MAESAPPPPRTAGEMLARGREFLERRGVAEGRREAELLVAHALGLERLQLFLQLDRPVTVEEIERARGLLVRRGRHKPVAYLTGRREFYGRTFRVGPGVLVPRPETELLVDLARERAGARRRPGPVRPLAIAELGTGSGCVAVTLALELAGSTVLASDVSAEALAFARANAEALGAAGAVCFVEGDGLAPLRAAAREPFDLLVSNPPYVDPAARASLPPDVVDHEPATALFAPEGDPDHWVRRLMDEGLELVRPGGQVLVELGADQGARARALATERRLSARLHTDHGGVPRVLEIAR